MNRQYMPDTDVIPDLSLLRLNSKNIWRYFQSVSRTSVVKHPNTTNESIDKSASFLQEK